MESNQKNIKTDLLVSLVILLVFCLSFFAGYFFLTHPKKIQRYEIYMLKTSSDVTCETCGIEDQSNNVLRVLNDPKFNLMYSRLPTGMIDVGILMESYSIFSYESINIVEIYNEIAIQEKCQIEKMEVDFSKFKVEEWGRANGSKKDCKVFFIYEHKL